MEESGTWLIPRLLADWEEVMTLCPVAIAVGCKKCPIFAVCPLKSQIGDYDPGKKPEEKEDKQ